MTALESRRVAAELATPPAFEVFPVPRWTKGPPVALEQCHLKRDDAGVTYHEPAAAAAAAAAVAGGGGSEEGQKEPVTINCSDEDDCVVVGAKSAPRPVRLWHRCCCNPLVSVAGFRLRPS